MDNIGDLLLDLLEKQAEKITYYLCPSKIVVIIILHPAFYYICD